MLEVEIEPWLFPVEPLLGESISHFLGRFRRANELTVSMMGRITGLGGAIARWEKFRFNPPPSDLELEKLAKVVGVDAARLREMLPQGAGMKLSPIRLCGACYQEVPCHRMECLPKTAGLFCCLSDFNKGVPVKPIKTALGISCFMAWWSLPDWVRWHSSTKI